MKKLVLTAFAALLALSVLARPAPGRGHGPGPFMHAPHHHHRMPGPWRPVPPPPRWEPFVAGVVGAVLLAPRYVWVEGHYETQAVSLPDGTVRMTSVWIPGRYVQVR